MSQNKDVLEYVLVRTCTCTCPMLTGPLQGGGSDEWMLTRHNATIVLSLAIVALARVAIVLLLAKVASYYRVVVATVLYLAS
jgi:hypothetical protein